MAPQHSGPVIASTSGLQLTVQRGIVFQPPTCQARRCVCLEAKEWRGFRGWRLGCAGDYIKMCLFLLKAADGLTSVRLLDRDEVSANSVLGLKN